jgi:hypothetical protein
MYQTAAYGQTRVSSSVTRLFAHRNAYDKLVAVLAKSHTERHTATALGQSFVKRFLIVGHTFDPINATSEKATCAAHNLSAYLTRR